MGNKKLKLLKYHTESGGIHMINEHRSQNHTTRREFLLGTAGLAMATLLPACSQTTKTVPIQTTEPKISSLTDQELQVSCSWVAKGDHENSYAIYKKAVEAATDFSWLSRGDRVLIKMALNSGNPYPATTDPWSVQCMVKLLKERGAGKMYWLVTRAVLEPCNGRKIGKIDVGRSR